MGFVACVEQKEHLFQMQQYLQEIVAEKAVNMMNWNNAWIHLFIYNFLNAKNFGNLPCNLLKDSVNWLI